MTHKNFVRWVILTSATTVGAIVATVATLGIVTSLESRIAAAVVLLIYTRAAVRAGQLAWRVDTLGPRNAKTRHDLRRLEYAADNLPWFGLIGTMVGILLLFLAGHGSPDAHSLALHVQDGIATVFVPSILAAVASRVIEFTRHELEHQLDSP